MLYSFVKFLCKLFFRVEVRGDASALERHEKLLIISNHQSLLDGILLNVLFPIHPVFVVYSGLMKNRFFRWVLGLSEHYTVDPHNPMAMKHVLQIVNEGRKPVMIFPEGKVTVTGSLMKVYDGPAFVAVKSGATIVPIRIDGAIYSWFSFMKGDFPKRLFPKITVRVFPAFKLEESDDPDPRGRRHKTGQKLRHVLEENAFAATEIKPLFTSLVDAADLYGRGRVAIEDCRDNCYTYRTLIKASLALGKLGTRVSGEGENVGVLLPNIAPTIALFYGLNAFNRVPAMLNYSSGIAGILHACETAKIKTVITSRAFLEKANLLELTTAEKNVELVYLEELRKGFGVADKLWLMLYAIWFPKAVSKETGDMTKPAAVLFTSGSEGHPKGVVLSHEAISSNIAQIRSIIDISPSDKFMNALPVFHAFGLTGGTLLPLIAGSSVYLYISPLHYRVIPEVAYHERATVIFGTSTFLRYYAKFANPYDFYPVRYAIAGAEKLAEDVYSLWQEKFGIRILQGYGVTECAPVLSVNTPIEFKAGSVGRLLPGIEYKLLEVEGIEEGGLLNVKGPNVMRGYYRDTNPGVIEPTESVFGKGWYNTGDIVTVDDEGFVTIRGRLKRFAKVAGEMVSLEAVESIAIHASPRFHHVAVTAEDPERGEAILLCTTDQKLDRKRLRSAAEDLGRGELEVARKIIVVDEIPRLGTGKVDFVTMQKRFDAGGVK